MVSTIFWLAPPARIPTVYSSGAVEVIYGGRSDSHAIGGTEQADTLTGTSADDVSAP
jgi:hypothetical protein